MHMVSCYYCHKDIHLFQSRQVEIQHRTVDGKVVPDEIDVCFWCALEVEKGNDNK